MIQLKSPYPWFGGKSTVAQLVWKRLGTVRNFVDPFLGSCAFLLGRPTPFEGTETINDADGMVCNFWRSVQADAESTAGFADWPVSESDLHARHVWLKDRRENLTSKLEGDPDYFDTKIAGWWVWGQCCWIGSGWCAESRSGPWSVVEIDGARKLVHLGDAGRGVNRQRVHLGDAGQAISFDDEGSTGNGSPLLEYFEQLSDRLRRVRICSGDWSRVCGPTPTVKMGITGIVLDPPYKHSERDSELYAKDQDVSGAVREWCKEWSGDKRMRIALFGYEGEGHDELESLGWDCVPWKAKGGYSSQGDSRSLGQGNCERERIWFSPSCVKSESPRQRGLFDVVEPELEDFPI